MKIENTYWDDRTAFYGSDEIIWRSKGNGDPSAYITQRAIDLANKEIGLRERSLSEVACALSLYYDLPLNFFCLLELGKRMSSALVAVKVPLYDKKTVVNHDGGLDAFF